MNSTCLHFPTTEDHLIDGSQWLFTEVLGLQPVSKQHDDFELEKVWDV